MYGFEMKQKATQNAVDSAPKMPQIKVGFADIWRFVWSYFWRYPLLVLSSYAALTVSVLAEVVQPLILEALVDSITADGVATEERFHAAIFFVCLMVGQGMLFHCSYRLAHFINCFTDSRVEKAVAVEALERVHHFSESWHADTFAGSVVTKIKRGMNGIHKFYDTLGYSFFRVGLITLCMFVLISIKNPVLGLIFFLFSALYAIFSISLAAKWVAPANQQANKKENKMGGALADTISAGGAVRAFAREAREKGRFAAVAHQWMLCVRRSWIRVNVAGLSQHVLINMFLKFLVMAGAVYFWSRGAFSAGEVVFIFTSYQIFSTHLSHLGDEVQTFTQSINDCEDVVRFFKTPLQVADAPRAKKLRISRGAIELSSVSFQYPGTNIPVYKDLSVRIAPGEKIALVGKSGSGKSTFLKLLQRFYDMDSGEILIDEQSIAQVTQQSLRREIALVPQDPVLFHRSLSENIGYSRENATQKEIVEAATLASADEFIQKLPHKYETLVGERGVKLSGGERQRVAIARAALSGRRILIFDEATSSLDSHSEKEIQKALQKLLENRTAILVAHRLSTIQFADRILVFDGGRIVESGSHAELLARKNGVYKRLYELQSEGFLPD